MLTPSVENGTTDPSSTSLTSLNQSSNLDNQTPLIEQESVKIFIYALALSFSSLILQVLKALFED